MRDLRKEFSGVAFGAEDALWDAFMELYMEQPDVRFVFVLGEWDFIFHQDFVTEADKKSYLGFLRSLLKDRPYVFFAYITGILPIACCLTSFGAQESGDSVGDASGESLQAVFPSDVSYSSGSKLNMFKEYDMATKEKFGEYFGFLDSEVDRLFEIYWRTNQNAKITRSCLAEWYDGYHTASGVRIYNPRSVVSALTDNQISNYWTSSGPYDEIFYYIRNNIEDVRDDLAIMVSGERAPIKLQGYIYNLAKESERMLKATLAGDTGMMAEILKLAHDTESPVLAYNSEIELAAVVNLVYLSARDKYRVEREDKAGEGYVDFIFYPERKGADALILELKVDSTPENAIQQIKDRNYALRLKGKMGETPKYTGRILAVGISYDRKTKEHSCKIEVL